MSKKCITDYELIYFVKTYSMLNAIIYVCGLHLLHTSNIQVAMAVLWNVKERVV